MTEVPKHIREFLVNCFNNENNGLINCETIITINEKYDLNLNINYDDNDNDAVPPIMFRNNCLDQIISVELFSNSKLPFNRIIEIINERIKMDNNNLLNPIKG